MIKLIKFILFLLNGYYEKGKDSEIAFLSAKLSFIILIFINLLTFLGLIGFKIKSIIPYSENDPRWMQYIKLALYQFIPAYIVISFFFRKASIISLQYNKDLIDVGKVGLVIYIALSVIAFFIWGHD